MTLFGMRKYPTPINKPMMPFFIGGVVMFFAMNSLASTMMETEEFKNDPRNPRGVLSTKGEELTMIAAARAKEHTT